MKKTTTNATTPKSVMHRRFTGAVVKVSGQKTIRVAVETLNMHPKYKKQYTTRRHYAVHDEANTAKVGNTVVFEECRPLSKMKRWRLVEIVK